MKAKQIADVNLAKYYKYLARLNFEAADAADNEVGVWKGFEITSPPPVMVLCAHSIELSLKAYLLDVGEKENIVRGFGHDLMGALNRCREFGADTGEIDEHVLEIISDLLVSGNLRYGEKSKRGLLPVYGPLSELVRNCLELCGAPSYEDARNRKV